MENIKSIKEFIPTIESMIDREINHLNWLKSIDNVDVSFEINHSTKMLEHYQLRLKQYKEY